MRFARIDTAYLFDAWKLEIRDARYSYAEGIVNILMSCTLLIAEPPRLVLAAFAARRKVSMAVLDGNRFVSCSAFVANVHQRPEAGLTAGIRSIGECCILDLQVDSERGASW
jgi:hypothetical protein